MSDVANRLRERRKIVMWTGAENQEFVDYISKSGLSGRVEGIGQESVYNRWRTE